MKSAKFRTFVGALTLLFAATLLTMSPVSAADDVNVRFSWKLKGEYAHLYLAKEAGIFEKHDLNVTLGEGAGSQAALGALIQGQEDVVIMPAIFALTAIQKGMPVKIIALYHPRTPVVIISNKENPVTEPKDLEGKKIATAVGETGTSYLGVFCSINNVDCDKINTVLVNAQARVPQFLQGQVDAVSVYKSNDLPILEKKTGKEFAILDMAKFGYAAPGMAVVTSEAKIKERADVLKRFLQASDEAIKMARADVGKATEAIKKTWSNSPENDVVDAQIEATMEAIPDMGGKPLGWVDEKAINEALDLLKTDAEFGEPKEASAYYTNELLQ